MPLWQSMRFPALAREWFTCCSHSQKSVACLRLLTVLAEQWLELGAFLACGVSAHEVKSPGASHGIRRLA